MQNDGIPASPYFTDVMGQAEVLRAVLEQYETVEAPRLDEFQRLAQGRSLVFIGMGSSLYAPYAAALWLQSMGRWSMTMDASETRHYQYAGLPSDALPVLVSQSGESAELVGLVERWRGKAYVAITNEEESPLARGAAVVLPLYAGLESATSSRTFTNTIAVCLLAAGAAAVHQAMVMADLKVAVSALQKTLDTGVEQALELNDLLGYPSFLDVLGRGPALGVANQAGLILREAAGVRTASHSVGLIRHGPIHTIADGERALVFSCRGATEELSYRFVRDLLERGAVVGWITDQSNIKKHPNLRIFHVPGVMEYTFGIPAVIAAELLGCIWAAEKGMLPGEQVEKITRTEA